MYSKARLWPLSRNTWAAAAAAAHARSFLRGPHHYHVPVHSSAPSATFLSTRARGYSISLSLPLSRSSLLSSSNSPISFVSGQSYRIIIIVYQYSISTECGNLGHKFCQKVCMQVPYAIFFLFGCIAAVLWPTSMGNFDKKILANLATELLTHSVVAAQPFPFLPLLVIPCSSGALLFPSALRRIARVGLIIHRGRGEGELE